MSSTPAPSSRLWRNESVPQSLSSPAALWIEIAEGAILRTATSISTAVRTARKVCRLTTTSSTPVNVWPVQNPESGVQAAGRKKMPGTLRALSVSAKRAPSSPSAPAYLKGLVNPVPLLMPAASIRPVAG